MIQAKAPAKTKTYTPISHLELINKIKSDIGRTEYIITGEKYLCSGNASVAIGTFTLSNNIDPELDLAVTFRNSYNKQYSFKLYIGASIKGTDNYIYLKDKENGDFTRLHKGMTEILTDDSIYDCINSSKEQFDNIIDFKDHFKRLSLTNRDRYDILGKLFFARNILTTYQLNLVKSEFKKLEDSEIYPAGFGYAWQLYNSIATALRESHPSELVELHQQVTEIFTDDLGVNF